MENEIFTLTVIIPSIGRDTIKDLIVSILDDANTSGINVKILIALNGPQVPEIPEQFVQVIPLSTDGIGFSAAINRVNDKVVTEYVSIIADDDLWLRGKIKHDLRLLMNADLVLPSVDFSDNLGKMFRPRIPFDATSRPSTFVYSEFTYLRSKRYLTISGSTFKSSLLRANLFREDFFIREDIEWLDRIHDAGKKIVQGSQATVALEVDLSRALGRENRASLLKWVSELTENAGERTACNFLSGAALKPSILTNDRKMISLITSIAKETLAFPYFLLFMWRRFIWKFISIILSQEFV